MILNQMPRWSADRRDDKAQLIIPILSQLNDPNFQELVNRQLEACALTIKTRGDVYSAGSGAGFSKTYTGLYRWRKFTGRVVLVIWDDASKTFTHFDTETFARWLGTHFDLVDSTGMNFGEPARATASRIWEKLCLEETNLPWASWELTEQFRREGQHAKATL